MKNVFAMNNEKVQLRFIKKGDEDTSSYHKWEKKKRKVYCLPVMNSGLIADKQKNTQYAR